MCLGNQLLIRSRAIENHLPRYRGSLRTCSSSAGDFCLGVCMQQVLSLKTKTNSCIYGRGLCLAHTECLLEVVEKKRVKCQAHMQGYFECYCVNVIATLQ